MFWPGEKTYGLTHEQLKTAGRQLCVEFSYSTAEERLGNILELDDRPLTEPRPSDKRSVGCCRDFALMLTSILRHKGIPARVRTGVALYFVADEGNLIEDHYVTEHWNASESRWQPTDPQIDDVQRPAVDPNLDVVDLSAGAFLTGWQLVDALRSGKVEPNKVGFPPLNTGLTYGRNKLFADFASLTGHELPVHAWWGLGDPRSVEPDDAELMDRMIELLQGIDRNDPMALQEALKLSEIHQRLRKLDNYVVPVYTSPLC